jgi:preprotein translocase subunit SecG
MITTVLLIIHVFVTLSLVAVILIQKSEGGGLIVGSGGSSSLFTARGTANLLTRTTAVLATLFLGNCILMSALTNQEIRDSSSFLDENDQNEKKNEKNLKEKPETTQKKAENKK